MSKILLVVILIFSLAIPASAAELPAPTVPQSGAEVMPEKTDSFGDGLLKLLCYDWKFLCIVFCTWRIHVMYPYDSGV